jgi:PEP-CTERM motif
MIKNSFSRLALVAALIMPGAALATTIDFESTPLGTYSSLSFGPVTITFLAGTGTFEVQNQFPDPPPSGHVLISFFTNPGPGSFQATFAGGASSVSIGVGDYSPSDTDDVHLRAYDAANNLLDVDFFVIPGTGPGTTLTVSSATPIARVEWNETGDFEGAVYWDLLTYDLVGTVPEPETLPLVAMGLIAAGLASRRRRVAK